MSYRGTEDWRAGVLLDAEVVDAEKAAKSASLEGEWASVRAVITHSAAELSALEGSARAHLSELGRSATELRLGPPVPDAEKILCIGLNYLDHQEESAASVSVAKEVPRFPMVFNKFRPALIGDRDPIEPPAITRQLDFESELAVVIGREARNVSLDEALDYVGGYSAFNDVSARDLQLRSPQWAIGKGFDTSGPFGPWLVTADEIGDPQNLKIVGRLNGDVMQESSTSLMIFPVAQLIEYISQAITLVPGDVIATGTPAGVGLARNPPRYMQTGDVFEVEVERIGTLTNPIVEPRSNFISNLEDLEVAQ